MVGGAGVSAFLGLEVGTVSQNFKSFDGLVEVIIDKLTLL